MFLKAFSGDGVFSLKMLPLGSYALGHLQRKKNILFTILVL